jgi:hypothetical protein
VQVISANQSDVAIYGYVSEETKKNFEMCERILDVLELKKN